MTEESSLSNDIARIRKLRKMSQQDLADRIGITRSSLSLIENGHFTPSAKLMMKISEQLGAPIGALFFNPGVLKFKTKHAGLSTPKIRIPIEEEG